MGYSTEFVGNFNINKPLEKELAEYINRFSCVRHMKRNNEKIKKLYPNWKEFSYKGKLGIDGEYFAIQSSCFGQEYSDDIISYNNPPSTQPGLWCQWVISDTDLSIIKWDGGEKFYEYVKWLEYIINNFLKPNHYFVNGTVDFYGEDDDDVGQIVVTNNLIKVIYSY